MPTTKPAENDDKFRIFEKKMRDKGLPELAIKSFKYYYKQLEEGQTGLIPEKDIQPLLQLPDVETFSSELQTIGEKSLPKTVLIKLNGGMGTSMGLESAKSLLHVKQNLSFLEITIKQAKKAGIPLLLMNSFITKLESEKALQKHPELRQNIPLDFIQHQVPKIRQQDLLPVKYPENPKLEWCPPGHGDIYTALITSGMLDNLLSKGYQYAFVSNIDNLGAVIDFKILGYFVQKQLPFMMEVADRTEADKKGGHLTQLSNGQLILRELAQCPEADLPDFQNISKHKYFNTNNLWINLENLHRVMHQNGKILKLPMIRNKKNVNPRDHNSEPVYQLETAMGSAIAVFPGAGAIRVPRTRFSPVKTTNDLLTVRSEIYVLNDRYQIVSNQDRKIGSIVVDLDPKYYKMVDQIEERFPYGPPSLINCSRLTVKGDIKFGKHIVIKGSVELRNDSSSQRFIKDDSVIEGK